MGPALFFIQFEISKGADVGGILLRKLNPIVKIIYEETLKAAESVRGS